MRRSLQLRILAPLLIVGVTVGLIGSVLVRRTYHEQLDAHMELRGESIAAALDSVIRITVGSGERSEMMQRVVGELGGLPDVTLIVVVTGDPPVVAATTRDEWLGIPMEALPYEDVQVDLFDAIESRRRHLHFHWSSHEYDVSWPLALQTEEHPRGEPVDGAIMLHLDAKPVRAQVWKAAIETTAALLGAIVVVMLLAWWLVDVFVLRRLSAIDRVLSDRGEQECVFAPELGVDEIGRTASGLNAMLRRLDEATGEVVRSRDRLEELVEERTSELKASHAQLRQSDRLATIGTMAAGLAHDLNNLLLPMRSQIHVLERMTAGTGHEKQLEDVKQALRFLQQLAESMRLCALDTEHEEDAGAVTGIDGWWEQVAGLFERAYRSRIGVREGRVVATIEPGLPAVGIAPHRLTQAVLNLIVNAGDACAERDGTVLRIEAGRSDTPGSVLLSVIDEGPGMASGVLDRAFDPFYTTKRRGASSGLGLSLVRSIVESVGGRVDIVTAVGAGTRVTLTLPAPGVSAVAGRGGGTEAERIAVTIEDELLASLTERALGARSHVVRVSAEGPPEADVWVLDGDPSKARAVEAYLRSDPARRVVMFGECKEGWPSRGITWIPVSSTDEELLRAVHSESVVRSDARTEK